MKKHIKKTLSVVLSIAMAASGAVMPIAANAEATPIFEGDTVLKEWKFDFGAEGSTPEDGYTLVTPDMNFTSNKVGDSQYGFLGIGEEDYKLTNRYDGWGTQQGQVIELAAGGGTGLNDAVGVVGAGGKEKAEGSDEEVSNGKDIFGNQGDIYYPTRFALKVADETYYRVKATVTTLDPSKDADVSLYTERKHPLYTHKTISAGETLTTEFSVRVTPIYYEKSSPTGAIKDEMLTVGVLGENSALASVEIQQVETIPTVWVLGDSTVTDGNCALPFFPLQNYTGVGTGLTKYLPRNIAMVNEGEGGLNAADNNHFNMVKDRIKAGDYMYVEYGHNHKGEGGVQNYKDCLDKYYNACHEKSAKLLIVSPVQSDNSWNTTTNKWDDRFGGDDNFEGAGKSYVAEKVSAGATDIAFVNLTKTSVAFVDKVTEDNGNKKEAAQFYYQTGKGEGTDPSHPNDTGAENFAYCAFEAMKEITDAAQKAVVQPLIDGMTDELPNAVPAEVMEGGLGGEAWPTYQVITPNKYPIIIKDIKFNDDGTVKEVNVVKQDAEIKMSNYGAIIITIYNADGTEKGKLYAVNQVDNSAGNGPQTVSAFSGDTVLSEGDTYSAVVVEADADVKPIENGAVYSPIYTPTDIEEVLITNENNNGIEDFNFYGAAYDGTDTLEKYNGWTKRGSSGMTLTLGESGDMKYATIKTDGMKKGSANQGSTYIAKDFIKVKNDKDEDVVKNIGTTGRYMVSMDMKYLSGGGMNVRFVTGNTDKAAGGTDSIVLFTVAADGKVMLGDKEAGALNSLNFKTVTYTLDMDLGKASLAVGDGDAVTANVSNYNTESTAVSPASLTGFMFEGSKVAFEYQVANLTVAKLKDVTLPEYTASVKAKTGNPETTVTVNADKAYEKAALIAAEYTDGGALKNVEVTPVDLTEGANTLTVEAAEGAKLMLWNSLAGMQPIAFTSETKPVIERGTVYIDEAETLEKTSALNTVMTTVAKANTGFVFMGWLDENGKKVSDDAEYTFRIRSDKTLTANFMKEPGVEDVKSFALAADKTRLQAKAGASVNVNIIDAVDADKTPISAVKNTDVKWSCDDSALTIENGVVTIPQGYTAGEAKKTVTVTGELNGITKTIALILYSSAYYEDFSEVTDVNEWITNSSTNNLNAIIDTASDNTFTGMTALGNGKACVIGNGGNGAGNKLEYTRDMELSKYSVLKFGFEIEPHQIRTDGRDAALTLQFVDTEGTKVFDISVHTGGKDSSFNGTAVKGFINGTAVAVDTELDFTNNTMKYTLTNAAGKQLASGTAELTAKNLDRMYFSGDWQYGKFAIDNIYADYAE